MMALQVNYSASEPFQFCFRSYNVGILVFSVWIIGTADRGSCYKLSRLMEVRKNIKLISGYWYFTVGTFKTINCYLTS